MILKSLARIYAEAFMGILEPGQYAEALEDLSTFAGLYHGEPRIRLLLGNPAIPENEKKEMLAAIAERARLLEKSRNFVLLLYDSGRLEYISDITEIFEQLVRDFEGRAIAHVTSAVSLSDNQVERLRENLAGQFNKVIEINVDIDPSLIGGMVVRVGDKVIDSTITNTLNTLKEALI